MPRPLPIHEQFYSFQGEGCHAGRAAYFIRTYGCPVHCPWCDSAGTWHPHYKPASIARPALETLVAAARDSRAEFVVITGGEPAIHDLGPLTDALHRAGLAVHLETSGAFPIRGTFDWITLSPKRWKLPLAANLARTDEFKFIVDRVGAIGEYLDCLRRIAAADAPSESAATVPGIPGAIPIWLHPEWSLHQNTEILNAITEWIKVQGAPFRAGWQPHKHYAADQLDTRSAAAVPLGGLPARGFDPDNIDQPGKVHSKPLHPRESHRSCRVHSARDNQSSLPKHKKSPHRCGLEIKAYQ